MKVVRGIRDINGKVVVVEGYYEGAKPPESKLKSLLEVSDMGLLKDAKIGPWIKLEGELTMVTTHSQGIMFTEEFNNVDILMKEINIVHNMTVRNLSVYLIRKMKKSIAGANARYEMEPNDSLAKQNKEDAAELQVDVDELVEFIS